eukprot:gene18369-biopygen18957
MSGSQDSTLAGDSEPTPRGVGPPDVTVTPPVPSLEVQMMMQQMKHQQEAHDAAMKVQQAESKHHDLQAQLLTEQISVLRANAEKARLAKEDTAPATSTGDAELEKLKRLPYCPYAAGNPFPPRPDIHPSGRNAEALRPLRGQDARGVVQEVEFLDEKIYSGTEGVVADTVLTKWLAEFDTTQAKNVMTVTAKLAAGAANRAHRDDHRVGGPPPDFDHGTSLRNLTPQQQGLDIETVRAVKTGAWVRARRRRHVLMVFLVPKPGTNTWRLVFDFRWLNDFCVKSTCKMEIDPEEPAKAG